MIIKVSSGNATVYDTVFFGRTGKVANADESLLAVMWDDEHDGDRQTSMSVYKVVDIEKNVYFNVENERIIQL